MAGIQEGSNPMDGVASVPQQEEVTTKLSGIGTVLVEIPMEEWTLALAHAKSLEEMNNTSSVKMEECPYNKGHRVPSTRFPIHLDKCRRKYKQEKEAKGQYFTLSCKYNHRHQVPVPELLFHEEHCEAGKKLPFYMLYFNPYFEDGDGDEGSPLEYNLEDCEIPEEELDRMYDGLHLNQFIGSGYFRSIPLSVIQQEMEVEGRKASLEEEVGEEQTGGEAAGQAHAKEVVKGDEQFEKGVVVAAELSDAAEEELVTLDEDLDLLQFDYLETAYYAVMPYFSFPTGLTVSQRGQVVHWNLHWMGEILEDAATNDDDLESSNSNSDDPPGAMEEKTLEQ